ncbi:MAG: alpha/beta fold hydrolase [Phyllobacteriaceae bacterium]|nr:alpha/beta fold hydrolase [Phyllobacteriaceae bacterium]
MIRPNRGAGPDLVLIHGFGGSHEAWVPVLDGLVAEARTHAVDLPGHAASIDYPDAGPPKTAVAAVLDAMTRRGVERFHLAGHSLGGAVATLIALSAPQRVLSLTLLAPGGFGPEINFRLLKRFASAREPTEMKHVLEGMFGFRRAIPDSVVEHVLGIRAKRGQVELLQRFADGMTRDGRQGVIPRASLATLAMPVRVLWGKQDNVLPAHSADNLPDNCAVTLLAETGHMLIDEAPDAVIGMLRAQIGAVSSAAP